MPEQIISASGSQYGLRVNEDGSINTNIAGSIFIGSVSASVDSIYVQSGDNVNLGTAWTDIGSVHISNIIEISGDNDIGSVVISSAPLIGVSGNIFDSGDITGSVVVSSSNKVGISGIVEINEVIPTDVTKQNPSYALVYDAADSISGIYFQTTTGSYFQGFLWSAGSNMINVSEWSTI